eukprot:3708746-Rhodomonas_salina.1
MFSWGKVENDGETTPAPIATAQKEVEAGQANLKIGEIEKALANFRRAIREVEHNVSAKGCEMRLSLHIMIGDLLLRVNKPNQAMEECTSAIAIDGRCVKAILLKARALIADGDMDAASIELNRAQELEPKNGEIADISATLEYCLDNDNNLASCLAFIDAQEYEQAICCLKKIVETAHSLGATRQLAHGCSYLGIVLQRMKGHQDQCVEWHQRHSQLAEGLGDIEVNPNTRLPCCQVLTWVPLLQGAMPCVIKPEQLLHSHQPSSQSSRSPGPDLLTGGLRSEVC